MPQILATAAFLGSLFLKLMSVKTLFTLIFKHIRWLKRDDEWKSTNCGAKTWFTKSSSLPLSWPRPPHFPHPLPAPLSQASSLCLSSCHPTIYISKALCCYHVEDGGTHMPVTQFLVMSLNLIHIPCHWNWNSFRLHAVTHLKQNKGQSALVQNQHTRELN